MFQLFNQLKRYFYIAILLHCCLFIFAGKGLAAEEYKAEYKAEYFPDLKGDSQVKLNIKIVNLRSDVYVKEFSLSFPTSFAIENVVARDDWGDITTEIENLERSFKVKLNFTSPSTGRNSENNFYLNFVQKNLFKVNNNVWEVILPAITDNQNSVFNIMVHLPAQMNKKLSIAKPKPTLIKDNSIYWNEVRTKMVYAVFGGQQTYQLNLTYNLQNEKIIPVYYDVAFPPETLYQKILIQSIQPPPEKTFLDEDGNYLGRYTLGSKEKRQIIFNGFAQVLAQPQEELTNYVNSSFSHQKNYLLTSRQFWNLDKDAVESDQLMKLKTVEEIYKFVTNNLNYNYKRVKKNIQRIGAQQILKQPDLAVCMEFTDLFIALAREKGIYAREINGYGFSDDPNLRPLSLISDILHSWPEYFDQDSHFWQPTDPTWENTSGIDYFNAFDLNHIVFAIHGKSPTIPFPAGSYKIENSRDIIVKIAPTLPKERIEVKIKDDIKSEIFDNGKYKARLTLSNSSNVFLKNSLLEIKNSSLKISPNKIKIDLFAPYQTYSYEIIYYNSALENFNKKETIAFSFNGAPLKIKNVKIISFRQDIFYKSLGIFIGFSFLLGIYLLLSKKRNKTY